MYTQKPLFYLLVLSLVGLSMTACDTFEQRDRTYTGPDQLEFAPLTSTVNEGAGDVVTRVQLIGPQRGSDLPVSFVVDDSSTAVEGTHYNLGATSATIEADSSSADVTIDVLDNTVNDGDTDYILYLSLQESEGAIPAANLRTYTLIIRGTDEPAP